MATIQGSFIEEQGTIYRQTKDGGWETTRTWEGEKATIRAFAATLSAGGAENVEVTEDGPTAKVSATYADAQDPIIDQNQAVENVTWELLGNDLEKNLKTHSAITPASDGERADLNAAEAAVTAGTAKVAAWATKAKNLFDHLSKGTQAYLSTQYVLRKTTKVGRAAQVQASLSNVNKVEAPVGVPTDLFNVPSDQGDGAIQWLKKPPTVVYLGKGKFSIAQEWWGGKWSTQLYGGSATP